MASAQVEKGALTPTGLGARRKRWCASVHGGGCWLGAEAMYNDAASSVNDLGEDGIPCC